MKKYSKLVVVVKACIYSAIDLPKMTEWGLVSDGNAFQVKLGWNYLMQNFKKYMLQG